MDALKERMAPGGGARVKSRGIQTSDPDPFYNHPVLCDGSVVGIVPSDGWGHRVGRALAFAYLTDSGARSGLSVEILGERHPAEILETPPYDPDNAKPKS